MKVYHLSQSLKLGEPLIPDYSRCITLTEPFVQALAQSRDCFYAMVLNGKYLQAVLEKFRLREWSDYGKWATEGAFEFIRRTRFPDCVSRLQCNYFYDNLPDCKALFLSDWGEATEEERAGVHLYEIELQDHAPQRRDMGLFDQAYDAMRGSQEIQTVLDCAHRYFTGEPSARPIWELLSGQPAKAVTDLTAILTE